MRNSIAPSTICPTLIGREKQLTTLQQRIGHAKEGEGGLSLISGEAGIGKSRLVAEAKAYAITQGFLLLQGNCFLTDLTCPYAPLLDLWRTFFAHPSAAISSVDIEKFACDLFPLLPELVSDPILPSSSGDPEQEKRRLFAVMANFVLRLARQQPVLMIVEDLQWSDETSLDFLHILARRSVSEPLFLLVTYRDDEAHQSLRKWLAQLDRERLTQEIRLMSLAHNEVDAMLSAIFEQQHTAIDMRRFLHGELLDSIYMLTEGNPFFVEEILTSLMTAGTIFYVHGYWNRSTLREIHIPRSVQDAVQQRMEHLSHEARHTLTLAAVAGRRFDFVLLQQLTQLDEAQLLVHMKELLSAQLVSEESAEVFAFRHALTREVIYKGLLARERLNLHRSIANTLEHIHADQPDSHLGDLASHFYRGEVWQKVVEYARHAGEQALMLYTPQAAIDYFSWALEAMNHLLQPPSPVLYRMRGQAYDTLGDFERAGGDYGKALESACRVKDRVAEWQGLIDLGFLWAGRDYVQAESWFRQALVLAQTLEDPTIYARSLNRIGNWYLNVEQSLEALNYHQQALTIFQELHNSRGIAETLDLLGMTSYMGGDLIQGTHYYQQAIALFRELDDRQGLTSSLATLTLRGATYQTDTMVSAGTNLAEVLQDARQALEIAREIGQRSAESYALFQVGLCLGSQGDYMPALEAAQQSLQIAEEIEHLQWQTASHSVLGGLYWSMLSLPLARQHFEQALKLARKSGSLFWTRIAAGYLASALVQLNDLSQAEKVLQAVIGPDIAVQTMAQRMVGCAYVELALAKSDPEQALAIAQLLAAESANRSEGQNSLRVLKLRGEALAGLGRMAEAEETFKAAQEIAMTQGVRPQQWRLAVKLGNLYQVQERNSEARQEFSAARMLIEELAAGVRDDALRNTFLEQANALLPRAAVDRSDRQAFRGLTQREREVATLIAQGKSNQAIADELVVTRRTVETHIGNIMFKLSCTSRTQIAVWAVETGLTEGK